MRTFQICCLSERGFFLAVRRDIICAVNPLSNYILGKTCANSDILKRIIESDSSIIITNLDKSIRNLDEFSFQRIYVPESFLESRSDLSMYLRKLYESGIVYSVSEGEEIILAEDTSAFIIQHRERKNVRHKYSLLIVHNSVSILFTEYFPNIEFREFRIDLLILPINIFASYMELLTNPRNWSKIPHVIGYESQYIILLTQKEEDDLTRNCCKWDFFSTNGMSPFFCLRPITCAGFSHHLGYLYPMRRS